RVAARLRQYKREARGKSPLDRADIASRLGLKGKALEILLDDDVSGFGWDGANLELNLLLLTGDARKVDEFVDPPKEQVLGLRRYYWFRARAALALGDYEEANRCLEGMDEGDNRVFRHALAMAAVQEVLFGNPREGGPAVLAANSIASSLVHNAI